MAVLRAVREVDPDFKRKPIGRGELDFTNEILPTVVVCPLVADEFWVGPRQAEI